MLELWWIWSTLLLSLPDPHWPEVVAPDRILSIGQRELNCILCETELFEIKLFWHLTMSKPKTIFILNWIVWNKTVYWCPWCNGYRRRKWTRRHEFKSWTRLIAFHIALIPLGNVWIQLVCLQLWVNSRVDWVLQPWWGN